MTDETSERIQSLESHVAQLERQVEQLNEVVIEQGRLLDKFRNQLRRLSETIETQELDRIRSTNAKPPHWGR